MLTAYSIRGACASVASPKFPAAKRRDMQRHGYRPRQLYNRNPCSNYSGQGLLFPRIPDTQMGTINGFTSQGERMRMKFRALVYLPVLISLGFLTACSTKNSSNTGGTGALFVTTQGDSLITPYSIDLSTGKFTANGKAVATDSMPSAVVLSPKGDADRKSTRLNSSHSQISYAVFCLKKKKNTRRSSPETMKHRYANHI